VVPHRAFQDACFSLGSRSEMSPEPQPGSSRTVIGEVAIVVGVPFGPDIFLERGNERGGFLTPQESNCSTIVLSSTWL
jgi:hypothetical protein